jgi:hypothetical protein
MHTPYSHHDCQYQEWRQALAKKASMDWTACSRYKVRTSFSLIVELKIVHQWIRKIVKVTSFIMVELMSCSFYAEQNTCVDQCQLLASQDLVMRQIKSDIYLSTSMSDLGHLIKSHLWVIMNRHKHRATKLHH